MERGEVSPPSGSAGPRVSPPTPAIAVGGWGAAEQGVGAPTWWGLCKVPQVPFATLQGRAQASPLSKNLPSSSSCRSNQSPQSLKRSRYFSVGNASGARLPGANLSRHRASPQTREDRRTTWGPARRRPPAALLAGSHGGRLAPSAFSAGRAGANAPRAGFTSRRLDLGTHLESLSPSAGQHGGAGVPPRLAGRQAPTSEPGAEP